MENRMVVAGTGEERNSELLFNQCRVSVWEDKVLEQYVKPKYIIVILGKYALPQKGKMK